MAHPQITRAHIEGQDFTLYYDYDQLRDRKLSRLTPQGKIEWFRLRMRFVFLVPIERLFSAKSPAHRELNSIQSNDLPARSFAIASFSILLNGIEALGSFVSRSNKNKVRFRAFITKYMSSWDVRVPNSPYPTADLKAILWTYFRNGIAHGFCISSGGIDNEADTVRGGWEIVTDTGLAGSTTSRLVIGPHAFFRDFQVGVDQFLEEVKNDPVRQNIFLTRFQKIYPS